MHPRVNLKNDPDLNSISFGLPCIFLSRFSLCLVLSKAQNKRRFVVLYCCRFCLRVVHDFVFLVCVSVLLFCRYFLGGGGGLGEPSHNNNNKMNNLSFKSFIASFLAPKLPLNNPSLFFLKTLSVKSQAALILFSF